MDGILSGNYASGEAVQYEPDPERRDKDFIAQQEFLNFVGDLRKINILPMPELLDVLNHAGTRTEGISKKLHGTSHRLFVTEDFGRVFEEGTQPDRVGFRRQPLLSIGKEDSRHQPFFGRLTGTWFHQRKESSAVVAVKPIPEQYIPQERLLHEAAMYRYVGRLAIPSLTLLGVAMFDTPKKVTPKQKIVGYEITEFDPNITTMDTLKWNEMTKEEMVEQLDSALDALALLHSNLVFHGDAEFKNLGIGESKNTIKIVDLEWGCSAWGQADNPQEIRKYLGHDLMMLIKSVGEYIFNFLPGSERPTTDSERFNLLHNLVYEPYFERLVRIDSEFLDVLAKAYDLLIYEKSSEAEVTARAV